MIRRLVWAAYWLTVLATTAAADIAFALPFTGPMAGMAGICAATGIASVGYACAPHPGDAR